MALRTLTDQASVDSFTAPGLTPKSGTIIASGAYQAADPAPAEFSPGEGYTVFSAVVNVSVISGAGATLTVTIEGYDKASNTWIPLLTSAGLVATGAVLLTISAYATAAANTVAQKPLFETMRVRPVKSGTTTTLSYSIGGHIGC